MSVLKQRSGLTRILVVEDHDAERRLLLELLTTEGFETIGCTTASEALEYVRRQEVGVAIIDLLLPDLSGTRLLELLRAKHEHIRVIIHTGQASYESAKEAVNLGAFAYVEKGGDPGELLRQVHRALWNNMDQYTVALELAIAERDHAQRALQKARDELEFRVQERTAALDQANEALHAQILERREAEEQVRARLRYEGGLASCSQVLLGTFDDPEALTHALRPLLIASDVSRVYVFENITDAEAGPCMRRIAEVCRPGIRPQLTNTRVQRPAYSQLSVLLREKLSNGDEYGGLVAALPLQDREWFEAQDIRSVLILPIQTDGDWYGFIGFDHCRQEHIWNEQDVRLLKTAAKIIGAYLERRQAHATERRFQDLLQSLSRAQSQFIAEADPQLTLNTLLVELRSLTKSEYGFIGEVLWTGDGRPCLRTRAVYNTAWHDAMRELGITSTSPAASPNLDTLVGQVLATGQPVRVLRPAPESRSRPLPQGEGELYTFLGLPLYRGEKLVGVVGLANRPGEYGQEIVEYLQPFLATCGNIIEAVRSGQLRRQAEEALRASEERFRQFAETVSEVFWMIDANERRILYVNSAFERVWGHPVQGLYENPGLWEESILPEDRERVQGALERWMQAEPAAHHDIDFRILRRDGHIRWIHNRGVKTFDGQGGLHRLAGVATDITERKRIEEALREREQQLLQALEDREAISQDLHDGVLQSLYAVGLALETSKPLIHEHPASALELLDQAVDQLNSLMREVRYFIAGLEAQPLQSGSFVSTLETLLAKLSRTHSMQIGLSVDPIVAANLSHKETVHLFYIVQEALSNSLRHGHARTGRISLASQNGGICLNVQDDGVGFDPKIVGPHGHGLGNMASRARKLGGELRIESQPGQGTSISLTVNGAR